MTNKAASNIMASPKKCVVYVQFYHCDLIPILLAMVDNAQQLDHILSVIVILGRECNLLGGKVKYIL